MRALRYHGQRDVRLEQIDPPGPPGPTEIQVKPAWSGICGSDLHEFLAGPLVIPTSPHPLTGCSVPIILGHEATGVVKAVGSEVTTHKPGDKVLINPTVSCGKCYACKDRQSENVCTSIGFLGIHAHTGAFTELMNFEAHRGLILPEDIPLDVAAVMEPVMVAMHAAKKAGVTPKDSVLIVGCGPVGLGLVLVCKQMGVKVIVSEVYPRRSELAKAFGADLVLNPKHDDVVAITKKEFDGLGAQFAFDISGNEASLDTAIRSIRIQGTVVVVALFEGEVKFKPNNLLMMEKRMMWVLAYSQEEVEDVIRLFGSHPEWREKLSAMISLRLGLKDAVEKGFYGLVNHRAEHIKILITSDSSIME